MYFLIKYEKCFDKYNEIWGKVNIQKLKENQPKKWLSVFLCTSNID